MMVLLAFFVLFASAVQADKPWPCDRKKAIEAFEKQVAVNQWPSFEENPYKNQTEKSKAEIDAYLNDHESVCAIRYLDQDHKLYEMKHFSSAKAAEDAFFTVTHQGRCGACSHVKDLAVYLKQNLTRVVRSCGMRTISPLIRRCLYGLGFTSSCVDIWEYNVRNTRSECFWVCMKSWFKNEPFNKPDGSLNDCLQCDEDQSGPVFKYYSGRTRRNSGITSAIKRPGSQVYEMNHCYY